MVRQMDWDRVTRFHVPSWEREIEGCDLIYAYAECQDATHRFDLRTAFDPFGPQGDPAVEGRHVRRRHSNGATATSHGFEGESHKLQRRACPFKGHRNAKS
jgi:hypothetical protein